MPSRIPAWSTHPQLGRKVHGKAERFQTQRRGGAKPQQGRRTEFFAVIVFSIWLLAVHMQPGAWDILQWRRFPNFPKLLRMSLHHLGYCAAGVEITGASPAGPCHWRHWLKIWRASAVPRECHEASSGRLTNVFSLAYGLPGAGIFSVKGRL